MHSVPPLSAAAEQALATHPWPGNVRELRNCMQRAVLLSRGGTIEPEHLVLDDDPPLDEPEPGPTTIAPPTRQAPASLRDQLQALEKRRIVEALDACAGNQTRAAAMLGISRRTLIARLEAYGIARPTKE
jgi:DNA-binding NtrC family response regulator